MGEQNNRQQSYPRKSQAVLKVAIAVVITAVTTGGGVYLWQKSIVEEVRDNASRNKQMLQKEIDVLQNELSRLEQAPVRIEPETERYLFKVYGAEKTYRLGQGEVNFYVAIPETLTLLEKLRVLTDKLGRFRFDFNPIEVERIEKRNGKMVGVINLGETEWNRKVFAEYDRALTEGREKELKSYGKTYGRTWRGVYFQGSTGGHFTKLTLTKTFLQEDYEGEWIDGVEFLYEGKPVDFQHCPLRETIYRERSKED